MLSDRDGVVVVVVMIKHAVVVLRGAAIAAQTREARLVAVRVKRENGGKWRWSGRWCNFGCGRCTSLGFWLSCFGDGGTLLAQPLRDKPGLGDRCSRLHPHPGPGGCNRGFGNSAWGGRGDRVHVLILPLKTGAVRLQSSHGIGPPADVKAPRLWRLRGAARGLHGWKGTFKYSLIFLLL